MTVDIHAFTTFGTSTVSDALDRLRIAGQVAGIFPLGPGMAVVGPAFTLSYRPVDAEGGTVGDYIDDIPPGAVAVLDNRGRVDATVWGDILTTAAMRRGIAGTVIDGVCRDGMRTLDVGYPMFTRGRWMRTGKDRVALDRIQEPVAIGGVWVRPDDIVVGDTDGVVVVPYGRVAEVLEVAAGIHAAEERIRAAIESGGRLDDARRQAGYHRLQTPAEG